LRAALIFSVGLSALHLLGGLLPTIFTWGFHFLGFLPKSLLLLYVFLFVGGIGYVLTGGFEKLADLLSRFMAIRPIVFLLLIALPYIQFFFGYVELYAVILFLLSAYILVSVLYLRNKIPFYLVPFIFTLLFLSHYLNALLGLSILYLAVVEFKRNRMEQL